MKRYWQIEGQVNDVGGSLIDLGQFIGGKWSNELRLHAISIACEVESIPEITNAWVVQVDCNGEEIINENGMVTIHHLW